MEAEQLTAILKYLKARGISQKALSHDHLVRTEQAIIKYKKGDTMPDIVENKIMSVFLAEAAEDISDEIKALLTKCVKAPEDLERLRKELRQL